MNLGIGCEEWMRLLHAAWGLGDLYSLAMAVGDGWALAGSSSSSRRKPHVWGAAVIPTFGICLHGETWPGDTDTDSAASISVSVFFHT